MKASLGGRRLKNPLPPRVEISTYSHGSEDLPTTEVSCIRETLWWTRSTWQHELHHTKSGTDRCLERCVDKAVRIEHLFKMWKNGRHIHGGRIGTQHDTLSTKSTLALSFLWTETYQPHASSHYRLPGKRSFCVRPVLCSFFC